MDNDICSEKGLWDANVDEYIALKIWYKNVYLIQEQKYRRLIALNKPDDDGGDASEKLIALYQEAETKCARIQELETLID